MMAERRAYIKQKKMEIMERDGCSRPATNSTSVTRGTSPLRCTKSSGTSTSDLTPPKVIVPRVLNNSHKSPGVEDCSRSPSHSSGSQSSDDDDGELKNCKFEFSAEELDLNTPNSHFNLSEIVNS